MLGSVITDRAQKILNDTSGVRWPVADLIDWLNEGQKAAVRISPEANTVTAFMQLVEGPRQNLTALAVTATTAVPLRLIDVTRNVTDATGLPALRAVRLANRRSLDQYNPDWPSDTGATLVQHYLFDSRNPTEFFVYPPQPNVSQGWVEIVYSGEPTDLASGASSIALADSYAAALVDYVVHRALSADAEYGSNPQRISQHYNQFYSALQQKTAADLTVEPAPATTVSEDG